MSDVDDLAQAEMVIEDLREVMRDFADGVLFGHAMAILREFRCEKARDLAEAAPAWPYGGELRDADFAEELFWLTKTDWLVDAEDQIEHLLRQESGWRCDALPAAERAFLEEALRGEEDGPSSRAAKGLIVKHLTAKLWKIVRDGDGSIFHDVDPKGEAARERLGALERLHEAVLGFGAERLTALRDEILHGLSEIDASGIFEDFGCRHRTLWDEYCHDVQEGAHEATYMAGLPSVSGTMDETVAGHIGSRVEALPRPFGVILTAAALRWIDDEGEEDALGEHRPDLIRRALLEDLRERARARPIAHLGPDRSEAIREAEPTTVSLAWQALRHGSWDHVSGLLGEHLDALVDPRSDLSQFAAAIASAYIHSVSTTDEQSPASEAFEAFRENFADMVMEKDVLPFLEDWRAAVVALGEDEPRRDTAP